MAAAAAAWKGTSRCFYVPQKDEYLVVTFISLYIYILPDAGEPHPSAPTVHESIDSNVPPKVVIMSVTEKKKKWSGLSLSLSLVKCDDDESHLEEFDLSSVLTKREA